MGGELEQSPEEMRVRWCVARDNQTLPQYVGTLTLPASNMATDFGLSKTLNKLHFGKLIHTLQPYSMT